MKITFFGTYEKDYPLNRNVIKSFKNSTIDLEICNIPVWAIKTNKIIYLRNPFLLLFHFLRLIPIYIYLSVQFLLKCRSETAICGHMGHLDVIVLKTIKTLFCKKTKIVFLPNISLYEAVIEDRAIFKKNGFISFFIVLFEKVAYKCSDLIIVDTKIHEKYFKELYNIPECKIKTVYISSDDDFFFPEENTYNDNRVFNIIYYGKFTPFHGLHKIVKAAKLLDENKFLFTFVGDGQEKNNIYQQIEKNAVNNVKVLNWVKINELRMIINSSDLVLGAFGDCHKTNNVIPNKIVEAAAMKKASLTCKSDAVAEVFTDKSSIFFLDDTSQEAIAEKIMGIAKNFTNLSKVEENAYMIYKSVFSRKVFFNNLIDAINFIS